ncbi:hypothetical protein [Marinagarivorans algicola]|uniref:hypothetical protein n=1 Tax=Marinagarivorans algicola TaxID=1513270 RepID=UPI003735C57F
MWPIVIVVLVVAMMIGPVMIMQPTKGQKRLAALRRYAAAQGLHVNASQIKTSDDTVCWFYWLPLAEKDQLPIMRLERQNYAHGLHVAKYWAFKTPETEVPQAIERFLLTLPPSVCGFETKTHAVGVHWSEAGGQKNLDTWLPGLQSLVATVVAY